MSSITSTNRCSPRNRKCRSPFMVSEKTIQKVFFLIADEKLHQALNSLRDSINICIDPPLLVILHSFSRRNNNNKKKVEGRGGMSGNQYRDEGCCFEAWCTGSTRVMTTICRYCNGHELHFIGCALSDIRLSRLLQCVLRLCDVLIHTRPPRVREREREKVGLWRNKNK